jgi:hypothetical protein
MALLCSYVRHVNIQDVNKISTGTAEDSFATLLPVFPNLYTLGVESLIRTGPIAPLLRETVRTVPQLQIKALELKCDLNSSALFQLLDAFPSVQFLRLGTEISIHPLWLEQYINRAEFRELTFHRTPHPAFLEWLLSSSTGSLKVLEFRDLAGYRMLPILSVHCIHIRSLRFARWEKNAHILTRMCLNLEELILYHLSSLVPLTNLPTSIQHFGFRNLAHSRSVNLTPVHTALNSLPMLRVLSCSEPSEDNHDAFTTLQEHCNARGVQLKFELIPFWKV